MNEQLRNNRHHKFSAGVPQGNVLDLRNTELAQKQVKKKVKRVKSKSQKPSWLERRRQAKQAKKQAKQEQRVLLQQQMQAEHDKKKQTKDKELNQKQVLKTSKKKQRKVKFEKPKKIKQKKQYNFSSWKLSVKPLALFLIVCVVLILPFASSALYQKISVIKDSVFSLSNKAFEDIKVGGQLASEFNFDEASTQFNDAFSKFSEAQQELILFNETVTAAVEVMPGKGQEYKSANNLLQAASYLSAAGEDLILGFDVLSKLDQEILKSVNEENPPSLTDVIVLGHAHLKPASEKIDQATQLLSEVDVAKLPVEYQDQLILINKELPKINASLKQVLSLSETMLMILGHEQSKRYLVVFQNNRELRATGGFLGSFGLIDIDKGEVAKMVIPGGGTYDLNGALKARVISPQPLHLINPRWEIQDANWYADWPTSAQKIEWFYNQSNGPTVDGVLSLTPDIIEAMLEITGPIDMSEEYEVTIDADNFYEVIQTEAEKKYDETQESKKIIADLTPKLLDKLFSLQADNTLSILEVFYNALREKDVLLYFNDPILEEEMINLGWSGSIKNTDGDYLLVVNTNIGGGKTDAHIEEIINHTAQVSEDGSITNTVSVTRTHKGTSEDAFANLYNWDYLRMYVPEGSQLIRAEGFSDPDKKLFLDPPEGYEIDKDYKNISGDIFIEENTKMRINKEFGKTVFGNWIGIAPGESKTVTISYKLPFKLETKGTLNNVDTYSLLVQKQPGSFNSLFNTQLVLPDNYNIKWRYPSDFTGYFDTTLDTDKYIGVVIAKEK